MKNIWSISTAVLVACSVPLIGFAAVEESSGQSAEQTIESRAVDKVAGERCPSSELDKPKTLNCPSVQSKAFNGKNLDGLSWILENPNAECDVSLSLPGLPNFGISVDKLDHCKLLEKYTKSAYDKMLKGIESNIPKGADVTLGESGASVSRTRNGTETRDITIKNDDGGSPGSFVNIYN